MAVSSEATVGHIIGFLRLDADQYFRELEKADAAANRLGKRKVDVKATAKTAQARGELDSLGRAVDRVDGAQKRAEVSAKNLGSAHQSNGRHMRALVVTALSLGPALGPLVGTTIGLAGALGSMGAAGVVALLGVKRELDQGTTLGGEFAVTIGRLKNEFHGLESTAANAALAPFNDMVREVTERMPFLNRSVNTFTNLLGSGSTNALTGIIDSLETMEPLLVSAGIWVDKLLAKFASVAAGGGLKAFTDYARSTLPLVTDTLENLVTAVVDLIRAFAPMGAGVLAVINDISQVIAGLPIGVLTAMASAASAGFLGFQAWRGITAIVNGVVGALTFMNSKMVVSASLARGLSLATAGVGVAIAAATFFYARHAEAARQDQVAVDGLTDALVESNGAITENVRQTQFKTLQDEGAIDAARTLGINLALVTSAALGNADAAREVSREMAAASQAQAEFEGGGARTGRTAAETSDALNVLGTSLGRNTGRYLEAAQGQRDWSEAAHENAVVTDLTRVATDHATDSLNRAGSVYGVTGAALKAFADGQQDAAAQADKARAKMILESDAAGILKAELDKLNGKTLNAAEAQNRFESSLANMSDHTTAQGKKIVFTTKSIHGMSAASVAIRGELIGQVRDLEAVAEANGGLANSTGKARGQLISMRQQIIDNAVAHGHDRKAVTAFIDTLFKIPKKVPPTKADVDKKEAEAKLAALQHKLGLIKPIKSIRVVAETQPAITALGYLNTVVTSMNGKTVTIKTRYVTEGQLPNGGRSTAGGTTKGDALPGYKPGKKDGLANANGNIFKAFANGGVESHVAQMAPAGAMRLWAEPETGGESYIPHAKSKRARSRQIWEETGRILGVDGARDNRVFVTHTGDIVSDSPADYAEQMRSYALTGQGG